MRGRLDSDGGFQVDRLTGFVPQLCPFTGATEKCGTWCPHFSEPIRKYHAKNEREEVLVNICHGRYWKFTEFHDMRECEDMHTQVK